MTQNAERNAGTGGEPVTEDEEELRKRALSAYLAQDLGGPARDILGFLDLAVEQARELKLDELVPDFESTSQAADALNRLLSRLIEEGLGEGHTDGDGLGGELSAKLRHDLRTPLNAIIGYSEMIAEELADLPQEAPKIEALRSDVAVIRAEAGVLLERIDAIVDFSFAEAGTLPATSESAAHTAEDVAHSLAAMANGEGGKATRQVGRILVVDDIASNRSLLSRRLTRDGHTVLLATSGAEALDCLAAVDMDVILLDVLMPDMNGIEVLAKLKANPDWARIPVIMISGLTEMDAVIRCIGAGADDYLAKPFNHVLLQARIKACLERKRWADRERQYQRRIEAEKERADALLHAILPGQVVARLNGGETVIADRFDSVSILFADLVGFTPVAAQTSPVELVQRLDRIFGEFDRLAAHHGVEKIKTIGDAYMAAAGVPEPSSDHAERTVALGQAMLGAVEHADPEDRPFEIRIGIHTGPVVAGLLGQYRFVYDVWGETVNIASRLEAHGLPGHIQLSQATLDALSQGGSKVPPVTPRGQVALKGIGGIEAYLLQA